MNHADKQTRHFFRFMIFKKLQYPSANTIKEISVVDSASAVKLNSHSIMKGDGHMILTYARFVNGMQTVLYCITCKMLAHVQKQHFFTVHTYKSAMLSQIILRSIHYVI